MRMNNGIDIAQEGAIVTGEYWVIETDGVDFLVINTAYRERL